MTGEGGGGGGALRHSGGVARPRFGASARDIGVTFSLVESLGLGGALLPTVPSLEQMCDGGLGHPEGGGLRWLPSKGVGEGRRHPCSMTSAQGWCATCTSECQVSVVLP